MNKKTILISSVLIIAGGCASEQPSIKNISDKPVGIVVSIEKYATEIGGQILRDGGNAIDAAVAVGFALSVTNPRAGNIGGGGFMVLRLSDGTKTTIDYREKAPLASTRNMYLDSSGKHIVDLSQEGYLSVGVPGSVAGMLYALDKYGTFPISKVLQPAIFLAKNGIVVDSLLAISIEEKMELFLKYPPTAEIFLKESLPYEVGDTLYQLDLAETLERIKVDGVRGFYEGLTAEYFESTMQKYGGIITKEDLINYQAVERKPVIGTYRGYDIISMPPPSSGGIVMLEILNILENFDFSVMERNSLPFIIYFAEAAKYAFADRATYLGDMDYYHVPMTVLTSKEYASSLAMEMKEGGVIAADDIRYDNDAFIDSLENLLNNEPTETTHYSVIDKWGNAVAVSTTLNSYYGSKVIVEGAGFILNNEMDDFAAKVGSPNLFGLIHGEANIIAPGKRMLSSMTPTIVEKDGEVVLITGSPGGSRIISTVTQVLINYIDYKMNPKEAVKSPRVHHQWIPYVLKYEKNGLNSKLITLLEKSGYIMEQTGFMGSAQTIGKEHLSGLMVPAPDDRKAGYSAVISE